MSHMPPTGPDLHCLDTVDSTSLELRRRLERAPGMMLPSGYTVLAREQTQGRGRLERVWHSPPGAGLMASFWLRLDLPAAEVAGFSLLPSLAVLDILHELPGLNKPVGQDGNRLVPQDASASAPLVPGCKWPNDIRVHGRKLCGILTECISDGNGRINGVIVGIGLNLHSAPAPDQPDAPPPVALSELIYGIHEIRGGHGTCGVHGTCGAEQSLPAPEWLAMRLSEALVRRTGQWLAGERPALLAEWLQHCDHLNAPLRVTIHGQKQWVHMRGLGPQGQLLVQLDGELQEVWADEIVEQRRTL